MPDKKIKCETCGVEYDPDVSPFCPACGDYNEEAIDELEDR